MRSGDVIEIFDGAGSGYEGRVEMRGSEVSVCGLTPLASAQSPFRITLAAALIKSSRFEWILEKCTELGVDEIIPLKTRWSDIRIPEDKIHSRLERWERILTASSQQSKRFSAPRLGKPLEFSSFLTLDGFADCTKILFYEKETDPWQPGSMVRDRIVVCIGPEGGWDDAEVQQAHAAGYRVCGLGPWILRAETAAIAAVSIIQHHLNLIGRHSLQTREFSGD
jgi:16S rRNA (uracil1498-N3)-methyltransferase